ncbi:MAG: sugar phosphate isomerase/epimerase [Cyanothece sp. SIO1E1]|nr:sugar phosphate isomerase/epimerase [Cyanothece sp. SIO1E1]
MKTGEELGFEIQYLYPFWGSEALTCSDFFDRVLESGFDGIEINLPNDAGFISSFPSELEKVKVQKANFQFIAQQVMDIQVETPGEYLKRVLNRLHEVSAFEPDAINSHTGKDYYSVEENCRIIEAIEDFSSKSGIPVFHEIHRGRFSFHSASTIRYIKEFPELKLVGDFSHWCLVSESLLQDQEDILNQLYPHIHHIHARIGTEQASQITAPFAPEWTTQLMSFLGFWQKMIDTAKQKGMSSITITPEFDPFPYMPEIPFTRQTFYNQHSMNVTIKEWLENELTIQA